MHFVIEFFKTKCDEKLQKGYIDLVPLFKEIDNFLCNVEVVQFIDDDGNGKKGQDMVAFLKFCPNMTKLVLRDCIHEENVHAVLQQKYRHLTHFSYINGSVLNLPPEQLKIFYETNPTDQCLTWKWQEINCDESDVDLHLINNRSVQCIQSMTAYATNLEHLFLKVSGTLTKCFDDICSQLDALCERVNFKSLGIRFDYEDAAYKDLFDAHRIHRRDTGITLLGPFKNYCLNRRWMVSRSRYQSHA